MEGTSRQMGALHSRRVSQGGRTMTVKHVSEVNAESIQPGTGVTKQVLIPDSEGPNFAMRRFVIQPQGGMPNHTNQVEHEQYVLNGQAKIGIGDQVFEVKSGDVVFIPAEVPHWYENTGAEPFEFLCMVPNKPDKISVVE
jgi:quercetin dioxygenase-like cupin family protein